MSTMSGLDRLARAAQNLGATEIAAEAAALAERIAAGRFHVACVGQFKRGKSTLINALVGRDVLPTGVVPVTTVVTVLRYGKRPGARVRYMAGPVEEIDPASVAPYVTEDENPENVKRVALVEVTVPSPLLAPGLCLVDTPGLGSVFEGNTAVTQGFVPHIDAAVVVMGGDPPLSHDELALVEDLARQGTELLFTLNKADRLTPVEREQTREFAEQTIRKRLGRLPGPIWEISATEAISGTDGARDWAALVAALDRLARESRGHLVQAAERRGLRHLAARVSYDLDEQRRALLEPVEDSARRVERLRACVGEAERSLNDLAHLFAAEQERIFRHFEERQRAFVARTAPGAREELGRVLRASRVRRGPALRRRGMEIAREIFERSVTRWRQDEHPAAEGLYRQATGRFVDLCNGVLARLADSDTDAGEAVFSRLPRTLAPEAGFRIRDPFFSTSLMSLTGRSPGGWLVDLFWTRAAALRSAERAAAAYLEHLLETNASRVVAAIKDQVVESRRGLEHEIRCRLRSICETAVRALDRARAAQAAGSSAVQHELDRLDCVRRETEAASFEEPEAAP
jgi:GTP-binding protein EngB required for normal cell division